MRFIYKQKHKMMVISGILLISALLTHFIFESEILIESLLIVASLISFMPIALSAYQALNVKVISIELLVTIAIIGAFFIQNYEESAVVSFLFLFGSYLEQKTITKTRSAIKSLTEMAPQTAFRLEGNEFVEVDIDDVSVADVLKVKTGDYIPVDGSVSSGEAYVNEATITGESFAVLKEMNDYVYAGTLVENGSVEIVANKVGADTTFEKIIELVEEAQDSKSDAQRFIDKFAKYYTPLVLIFSIILYIITKDLETAITLLVLGCPGALVIGIPVSNVAAIGSGAKSGILIKGSDVIQNFSQVDTFIFDKTGTLSEGNPTVTDCLMFEDNDEYILSLLGNLEAQSNHPLSKAILSYIGKYQEYETKNIEVLRGEGLFGIVDGLNVLAGNLKLMDKYDIQINKEILEKVSVFEKSGHTVVLLAYDNKLVSILAIKDVLREGVSEQLSNLKKLGVKEMIVLSGDNQGSVDYLVKDLEIDHALGNMHPEDKAEYLKDLQEAGRRVAFVGDGINDSPSLALAEVGIAMGNGTDVALEASDVVLMNSDIKRLSHAYALSKASYHNMIQNIVLALAVVFILFFALIFSEKMSMAVGMLVHEGSILFVIFNGMRLLRFKERKLDMHQVNHKEKHL